MKMYKEAYASGSSTGTGNGGKGDFKKSKKNGKYGNGSSYKGGDYKKGNNRKKPYNKNGHGNKAAPAPEQKKTFWQKVKAFFGR